MKTKSFIKIISAVALVAAAFLSPNNCSAQTVLAGWDVNGLANSGPSPFAPSAANANLIIGGLTKGAGVTNTTTGNVWGGNSWTNAGVADSESQAINGNNFVTFTIQPDPGYTLSVTNLSKFYVTKSATGPASGELQWSTNGITFTDVTALAYGVQGTAIAATSIGTVNLSGIPALQNVNSNITVTLRIVNWGATGFAGTWYVGDGNASGSDLEVQGVLTSSGVAPNNLAVSPSGVSTNAGSTVVFNATASGDPASNFWYKVVGATTNLIPGATAAALTLNNVSGADTANYFVILTNASGSATSGIVSLAVIDPFITDQPASAQGLLDGTVHFSVTAAGTSLAYRWYFSDLSGNIIAPVNNGAQGSGSVISGAASSALAISNLQPADPANFVVVVTNVYGAVTSSVASLLSVNNTATLTFWNFNNTVLSVNSPAPYYGVGAVAAAGTPNVPPTSPFFGVVDPADGPGFGLGNTNRSWGTSQYPASGSNKQNGVQFNTSTVGAKNITVSYDSRATGTASGYERLQYTTNGTDWIDYPTSSSFIGRAVSTYYPFSYSLAGFPGAANNPSFGIRVVTEFQSTATYGIGTTNNYVGTANTYGTGGTLTYDIVTINGDAITNNNTPPGISAFSNTNTPDFLPITNSFTVGDLETAAGSLTVSAVSLNPSKVNPTFTFGGSGASRTMIITPHNIPDQVDAAPILVTVTDGNGDSTATWFILTLTSVNLAPTNSLTTLAMTNTLVNTPITIPFKVGDDRTAAGGLTYSVASGNNAVIPGGNIVISGAGTANPAVTITPASNQVGVATISVTVNDNDALEPRSTTANIAFMVRPNTNVVAIDYFSYDTSGALDTVSGGFWQHLSGNLGQMPVNAGVVTVDTFDNTENLQAQLLGSPYKTNSGASLYSSFMVNMDPSKMPVGNGTYFALFNDGSGVTGNYECRVIAATNGAAPGYYRIGINNFGADATSSQMFPQDLVPGSNYVVVTSLLLTNGFSTVWVNPGAQSSISVTDTSGSSGTNLFNIADFELRESGANGGSVGVSQLKVGTTFDSVFPALHIQALGTNAVVNWSDPTLAIQSATNVAGPYADVSGTTIPYTNNASTNTVRFFRFKP